MELRVHACTFQDADDHLALNGAGGRLKLCLKRIAYVKDLKKTAVCLLKAERRRKRFSSSAYTRNRAKQFNAILTESPRRPSRITLRRLDFRNIERGQAVSLSQSISKERSKRSPYRLVLPKDERETPLMSNVGSVPPLLEHTATSPVHRVSDLFIALFGKVPVNDLSKKWSTTYGRMEELTRILESNKQMPGARVYGSRVYDIVTDSIPAEKSEEMFVPPFLKDVFDIVNSFEGAKNARVLSPRIAPLAPDKMHSKGLLSPAIFPFYKDDTEQQIMPVPTMLEAAGFNDKDRGRVLEMVMEISGARETVDNAMKVLHHLSSFGLGEELLSVTENIGKVFEGLRSSLSSSQNNELESRGYTFMEQHQMQKLYKDQDFQLPEIDSAVDAYGSIPVEHRDRALWSAIAEIAGISKRRQKREFQPISVLKPTVLSPYQFAPVYGFSVLGPVVLSPNIFSPLILNPSVLGPWVLSPSFPLPFIISPYLLSPYVLSPLGMAPFVFSPYVLSPNVINPYLLSPLVLSPVVLCPDVLSPMVLGGQILSPSVLSPSVLSKSFLMAIVLSPSLLS